MRCRFRDDTGSVTAEFALTLPAVVLVLAVCLSGAQVAGQQLRLQDAAAAAARSQARGGGTAVASRLAPGANVSTWRDGDLDCVELTARASGFVPLTLRASSCALAGGA